MTRNPCSSAVAGLANRRFAPRPTAGGAPGRYVAAPDGAPVPGSSRPSSWPTLPICRHRPHRPRLAAAWETGPTAWPGPTGHHLGPVHLRGAPPLPAAVPGYPPRCAACARSPVCRRRTLWAPFFRGLDRLAVDDRRAGTGLAALSLSQRGVQGVVGPLPSSVATPGAEVVEDDAPGRQVVGQHSPGAAGAQNVADGVDDLPPGVGDRPSARFGRWQQGFPKLPFPVADVAGVDSSFHTPTLHPTPKIMPLYRNTNSDLFRHPLSKPPPIQGRGVWPPRNRQWPGRTPLIRSRRSLGLSKPPPFQGRGV